MRVTQHGMFNLISSFTFQCFKLLGCDSFRCHGCNYPMCDEKCAKGKLHSDFECEIFQRAGYKAPEFLEMSQYRKLDFNPYMFVSTLRCLLLKSKFYLLLHFMTFKVVWIALPARYHFPLLLVATAPKLSHESDQRPLFQICRMQTWLYQTIFGQIC